MNKLKTFLMAAFMVAVAGNVQAQKSGYINMDQMIGLMPELGKIDTLLQKYQADSINTEFANIVKDYNYRDSILKSKDTVTMPTSVKAQHRQEMDRAAYQVQNWQQISQQAMQQKQQELLAPVYQKVYAALNQVAKENGYGFIYREEALLVAPPSDNLLPMVAKKLNIKLPAGAGQPTAAPANNAPRSTTGAKKGT